MSKTWITLIIIALFSLLVFTAVDIYNSLSGGNNTVNYTVDPLAPNLGDETLKFVEQKQDTVKVTREDI